MSRVVLLSTGAMTRDPVHDFDGRLRRGGKRRYLLPGEGRLDLQGFLNGLAERGYSGGLTLEATAVGDDGALDPERLSQMAAVVNQLAS